MAGGKRGSRREVTGRATQFRDQQLAAEGLVESTLSGEAVKTRNEGWLQPFSTGDAK